MLAALSACFVLNSDKRAFAFAGPMPDIFVSSVSWTCAERFEVWKVMV